MNVLSLTPAVPAADGRQETAPAACERGYGTCCAWACCREPVRFRPPTRSPVVEYLDIEAMADLDAPLGSPEFFAQWHDASARKEAAFLEGDDGAHRAAWEA